MEYNTSREKMILPEFGRNIQDIIEYIVKIEDREVRTRAAYLVVNIMSNMDHSPQYGDFNHKMWDQLFIMSDYKLDVDSPYPMPKAEDAMKKPGKVDYNVNDIYYRHYGNLIHKLILKVVEMDEGDEKKQMVLVLASHLKKLYLTWNRDTVDDKLIFKNLEELCDNKLKINYEQRLALTSVILNQDKKRTLNKKARKSRSNKKKKHTNYF